MPQLDALRTFAVFAVMVHHFWPEATFNLPLGFVGVQLLDRKSTRLNSSH